LPKWGLFSIPEKNIIETTASPQEGEATFFSVISTLDSCTFNDAMKLPDHSNVTHIGSSIQFHAA
jgi:hypothetical protein